MKSLHIFLIATTIFSVGEAILCYGCRGCKEPFDSKTAEIVNCTEDVVSGVVCVKAIVEFNSGRELVVRLCERNPIIDRVEDQKSVLKASTDVVSIQKYYCRQDKCNDAASVYPPLWLLMISISCINLLRHVVHQ